MQADKISSKGGKKGKAAKVDDAPKAEVMACKDRNSAAADAAGVGGVGAAGARGGRKRGWASMEEAAEEVVVLKKLARAGDLQSKTSAGATQANKKQSKGKHSAVFASPEKPLVDKSSLTKCRGKAAVKAAGGRATKRGGKTAAEKSNEENKGCPVMQAQGGRAGKLRSKSAATEVEKKLQKVGKSKGSTGKVTKAAPKTESAAAAATRKPSHGMAVAAKPPSHDENAQQGRSSDRR